MIDMDTMPVMALNAIIKATALAIAVGTTQYVENLIVVPTTTITSGSGGRFPASSFSAASCLSALE